MKQSIFCYKTFTIVSIFVSFLIIRFFYTEEITLFVLVHILSEAYIVMGVGFTLMYLQEWAEIMTEIYTYKKSSQELECLGKEARNKLDMYSFCLWCTFGVGTLYFLAHLL